MYEVVDSVEVPRPRRVSKPGTGWRDNFAVPPEKFEKASLWIDGLKAVQQQDLTTRAASHDFELDPAHRQPLTTCHHILPSANPRGRCIALIDVDPKPKLG